MPDKSISQSCRAVGGLSGAEKYHLLYHHVQPPKVLPSTYSHGCNRKFTVAWLEKYPWLRYSPSQDGVYCGPCAVMLSEDSRRGKQSLVNKPFSNWVKISRVLSSHSKLVYHRDAAQAADVLKSSVDNPGTRIDVMTSPALQVQIGQNEHILQGIVRAILFLAKQGLPFRGDVENVETAKNPGNFLALMKLFAETDPVLHDHVYKRRAKNVTYLSPKSQNDIISVIGYDVVRANIVEEIQKAGFFSVLADEVSSHNVEHMPICLRFVDERCDTREDFVAFVRLDRVRATDITKAIVATIEELGLSLNELRGQGYDGAATMKGEKSGVQKQIRDLQPKAVYTHCAGHSLNLSIVTACSIPLVSNCIEQIKSFTLWIEYSAKREGLLKAVCDRGIQSGTNRLRKPILNVCITRWVENIEGWERFSLAHPFLIKMCEVIIYGDADYEIYNDGWRPEDKRNALAHLKALESFEFVYVLVTLQRSLLYMKEAAVQLQGENQDIVSGYACIEQCCSDLKDLRANVDKYAERIFQHSCRLAECSGITVAKPRVTRVQQHRSNPETESVEQHFKCTVIVPFLDHLISDLSSRFNKHAKQVASLQGLLPIKLTPASSVRDIEQAVAFYYSDLPNASILDEEFHLWKVKWLSVSSKDRPQTITACLKNCSLHTFPNIFNLLKLFATLPLSSCSCERSASALRRLNNYLRCTQKEERLTALGLVHTHYHAAIDVDTVCKIFIRKHPRRMEAASLLFQ